MTSRSRAARLSPDRLSADEILGIGKDLSARTNVVGIFLRVPLTPASTARAVGAARLPEGPRVTRNLSVEPTRALTLLGHVPSAPR